MTLATTVDKIVGQTRKNGNLVLNQEQIDLLNKFKGFDISNDWMEGKDITKLEKLLKSNLVKILDISFPGGYSLIDYSMERMHRNMGRDTNFVDRIKEVYEICSNNSVFQIVDKWDVMKRERSMQNGKLPKAARIEQKRKEIKGNLDPKIKKALETITKQFKNSMVEYYKKYYQDKAIKAEEFFINNPVPKIIRGDDESKKKYDQYKDMLIYFSDVTVDGTAKDTHQLDIMAENISEDQSLEFFFKMADKLGGLKTRDLKEISVVTMPSSTTRECSIKFDFESGATFTVDNKMIINTSPLGNPFYQYPTTFRNVVTPYGECIDIPSEYDIKKVFNFLTT